MSSLNFLALYALSVIACARTNAATEANAASGGTDGSNRGATGGTGAKGGSNRSGTGGTGATASAVDDGGTRANDSGTGVCTGAVVDFLSTRRPRYEQVQCYVADASKGKPSCLPAGDSALVQQLGDDIRSCGFVVELVIEAADDVPIPAACEPLLACCAAIVNNGSNSQGCYDLVDRPELANPETCSSNLTTHRSACAEAGGANADNDAGGATPSDTHALCCYRTCGHTLCT